MPEVKTEAAKFRENADVVPESQRLLERGISQEEALQKMSHLPEGVGQDPYLQAQMLRDNLSHLPPTADQSQYPVAETARLQEDGSYSDPLFAVRRAHELHGDQTAAGALLSGKQLGVLGGVFCPAVVRGIQKQRLVRGECLCE
jgi:hypothetical protein